MSPSDRFMVGRFELTGDHALSVHDALHAVADELFHQHTRDRAELPELEIPSRNTLLALALEEVCRRALAVDRASSTPPRVEATITLHTRATDRACHSDVDDDDDDAGVVGAVWWIHDRLGRPLPAETLPAFLCDATFHAALLDSLGVPVDMGRDLRSATPAQRRALTVRDGGCAFPGCDCPATWCDAHHIARWTRDIGPTDLDNLVLLCRRHHRVAHRRGWTVTLDDTGWTHWTTPTGAHHAGQRHHQRAGP